MVKLMGWVHRRRDFGPLTFIDLRDREGVVQVVFDEEKNSEAHRRAKDLRSEYVVGVVGKVVMRDKDKVNPNIKTGRIEVIAREIYVLNDARTPPFEIDAQGRERRGAFEIPLPRSAPREDARQHKAAPPRRHSGPPLPGRARLLRDRNADDDQDDSRRRARLHRAEPARRRELLRLAAVAADIQATADGRGLR